MEFCRKFSTNFYSFAENLPCYGDGAHSICNLKYKVPTFIPVIFHNGSIYDNHLIIKQISEDFHGNFTEKY